MDRTGANIMSVAKDKRTGKWMCRVSYKENEKYKQITRKGFSTKKEAQINEAQLKLNLENRILVKQQPNKNITFADYFENWARKYKIGLYSASTDEKYEYDIKLVHKYFGRKKIAEVTRDMYQDFINQRGKGNGKDIVEKTHGRIKACMQDALYEGLINRDPTYKSVLRYEIAGNNKLKYWNEKEFHKIIYYLKNNMTPANLILYIAALTGLRIGEIYGLSWDDIQLNKLSVNKNFDYKNNEFTPGKTKSSIRTISITESLYNEIIRYKNTKHKSYNEHLFIDKGKPCISYNGLRKHLKKICNMLVIDFLPIHSFRHSHCSYLIFQGVNIHYISKRLGHTTVIETLKTYSHIFDEFEQLQNNKVIDALTYIEGAK